MLKEVLQVVFLSLDHIHRHLLLATGVEGFDRSSPENPGCREAIIGYEEFFCTSGWWLERASLFFFHNSCLLFA